uniref:Uncharacterized protein n=1 Tax=Kalanchoe fedtschenkoi TaxID=63787 RepID=A0A7N0USX0_KALFE
MSNIHHRIHPVESKKRKGAPEPAASASSQQLLAGYMAYEFLTRGTLLGQKFDPARAEAVALSSAKRSKSAAAAAEPIYGGGEQHKSYAEVASLLKTDGVSLPWVVNPTQLARWVQM